MLLALREPRNPSIRSWVFFAPGSSNNGLRIVLKMIWKLLNFLLLSSAFVYFLYGIRHIHVRVEQNACRMTYMFENPQFSVSENLLLSQFNCWMLLSRSNCWSFLSIILYLIRECNSRLINCFHTIVCSTTMKDRYRWMSISLSWKEHRLSLFMAMQDPINR